jgi:uncharacterized protein YidB (DUF937 family)
VIKIGDFQMKFVKIAGVATMLVIALTVIGVTLAFAQQPTPTENPWWNTMRNMMQGQGGMMGGTFFKHGGWASMQQMHDQMSQNGGMDEMHRLMTENGGMGVMYEWMHQSGGMHETIWADLAEQLGLTAEEFSTQVNNGKTLAQIADEKGVAIKDLATAMENGMKAGLEQAVNDNQLTQEQAEQLLNLMESRYEWMITNMGLGMMGDGGMMSPGAGGCHGNN